VSVKVDLLVRDLGAVEQDTVLDDAAYLIARVGCSKLREVKEVTVDGRDAAWRTFAHRTCVLQATVNRVVGESYGNRVLDAIEGEDVDCGLYPVRTAVDGEDMQTGLTYGHGIVTHTARVGSGSGSNQECRHRERDRRDEADGIGVST
jgi:hypothetical protein